MAATGALKIDDSVKFFAVAAQVRYRLLVDLANSRFTDTEVDANIAHRSLLQVVLPNHLTRGGPQFAQETVENGS